MPKKVLVTGAAGFLGRYVARAASQKGSLVTGIGHGVLDQADQAAWGISKWHEADVTLEALMDLDTFDVIFHCAGGASVAQSLADPLRDFRRTVDSTLAVLELIRLRADGTKLVLTSSAGVYGKAGAAPFCVGSALHPVSPYGLHKKIAEDLCRSYGAYFGVRTAIVRLFSVYGPELRKQLLWDACIRLSRGDSVFSGTGEETRDWLHVADATELLLIAAQHASAEGPTVNGGTGVSVTVREIVETLGKCLPDVAAPRFSGEKRAGDPDHYQADIAGAVAWGWAPKRPLKAGLHAYTRWFEEQRK